MKEFFAEFSKDFTQSFIEADRWKLYLKGIGVTLEVTVLALLIGLVIGLFISVVRCLHDQNPSARRNPLLRILNGFCHFYTTVIRGTPMMVQLLIMYFVIFASSRNQIMVAVLAFGINSGAYISEIVRGGIMSVDRGQMEAGRSIGLNYLQTMRYIIIPQALKSVLPSLGNELITLLKETSIVTVIGLRDLTKAAMLIQGKTYQAFMPFIGIALIYLLLVLGLSFIMNRIERRLRVDER